MIIHLGISCAIYRFRGPISLSNPPCVFFQSICYNAYAVIRRCRTYWTDPWYSRGRAMTHGDDALVEFLLDETGDTLHVVIEYDRSAWEFLFVRDAVRERIEDWEMHADKIFNDFRYEAQRNADREQLLDVGSFHCSLHLFDGLLLVHFSHPDERGIIFGHDPSAASNLTAFVNLCLPHIREHGLSEISTAPAWSE